MTDRSNWYVVRGVIRNTCYERLVEAFSARHACYRFCRDFGVDEAEDVPGLCAENIFDPQDKYVAKNRGYLR